MADPLHGIALIRAGRWDEAHALAQDDPSAAGAWLHGILHILEGDQDNARHWYRHAGRSFPGMDAVEGELAALERSLLA